MTSTRIFDRKTLTRILRDAGAISPTQYVENRMETYVQITDNPCDICEHSKFFMHDEREKRICLQPVILHDGTPSYLPCDVRRTTPGCLYSTPQACDCDACREEAACTCGTPDDGPCDCDDCAGSCCSGGWSDNVAIETLFEVCQEALEAAQPSGMPIGVAGNDSLAGWYIYTTDGEEIQLTPEQVLRIKRASEEN